MVPSDLRQYVRTYPGDLAPGFCRQLVANFERAGELLRANGSSVRLGLEQSAWTELDLSAVSDAAFKGFFLDRIAKGLDRYNQDLGLKIPIPFTGRTAELIVKRYRVGGGERFQLHFDSINQVANRYLVFLWYLNDVAEGGETEFPDLDLRVAPQAGTLLIFPPFWMYQHQALPPRSTDKYILSTYLLF